MKWLAISCILYWHNCALAQSTSTLMGARSAGMGYVSATLGDDYAVFNNIGALSENKSLTSVFAYEGRPALPGGDRLAAGIILPTKTGVAGVNIFRFGDDVYSEQIVGAGFSNKFGITSLGIRTNFIQYRIAGSETRNAVSVNFGGMTRITPQIIVGAYIVNINQAKISESERLPTRLTAGVGLRPDEHIYLSTEIEKDIDYDATWKLGGEYAIQKKIFARTGFNLNPSTIYFGIGAKTGKLSIDYALAYSRFLGSTHQVSAIYRIKSESTPR